MLIVTPEDFSANIKTYDQPVQIEENGNVIGQFFPKGTSFFAKLFSKKDHTVDEVRRPSRQLRAALRESKRMEKHPERYKTYKNIDELYEELGIEL